MKWIPITKEQPHPYGGDIVKCIAKLKSGDIVRINYNYDGQFWYYPSTDETHSAVKKDCSDIFAWVDIRELDKNLSDDIDPMWCWEFGSTLADTAIKALSKWIERGLSYPGKISEEEWNTILTKILNTFKLCKADLDGDSEDLNNATNVDDRKKVFEDHRQKRREGFELLADYYLDLWD